MKELVWYIHGQGGSAAESERYRPLFPESEVVGLDYRSAVPWEASAEIRAAAERLKNEFETVTLIANSIGAYFCMLAGIDELVTRAYFISPIVDMERLICDMMARSGVSEASLKEAGVFHTASGEVLSWEYLSYAREHPVKWCAPTAILYGEADALTSFDTIKAFASESGSRLTVMMGGEHWFHTTEQLRFLDAWLREGR